MGVGCFAIHSPQYFFDNSCQCHHFEEMTVAPSLLKYHGVSSYPEIYQRDAPAELHITSVSHQVISHFLSPTIQRPPGNIWASQYLLIYHCWTYSANSWKKKELLILLLLNLLHLLKLRHIIKSSRLNNTKMTKQTKDQTIKE